MSRRMTSGIRSHASMDCRSFGYRVLVDGHMEPYARLVGVFLSATRLAHLTLSGTATFYLGTPASVVGASAVQSSCSPAGGLTTSRATPAFPQAAGAGGPRGQERVFAMGRDPRSLWASTASPLSVRASRLRRPGVKLITGCQAAACLQ